MSLVSSSLFLDYEFLGKWIKKLGEGLELRVRYIEKKMA